MRGRFSRWIGLAALTVAVAGCGGGRDEDSELPLVGVVLPLTGEDSQRAAEVLSGMELRAATSEGARIEVLAADGAGEPVASARRLLELASMERLVAVVGGWHAAVARPLAALAHSRSVPFLALSPMAAPGGATVPVHSLHRLESLAVAAAVWAAEGQQWSVAGVLRDPASEASTRVIDAFAREFTARGGRVAWTAELDAAGRARRPDGPETAVDLVLLGGPARHAHDVAALGPGTSDAHFVSLAGWETSGDDPGGLSRFHVTHFVPEEERPAATAFRTACQAAGLEPTEARALGWDAAGAVLRLGADTSLTRRGVEQALRTGGNVPGATGRLALRGATEAPAILGLDRAGATFVARVEAAPASAP